MTKKSLQNSFRYFFNTVVQMFVVYLLLILILTSFRLILLFFFNDSPELYSETKDLLRAFHMGFRFDTLVACFGLAPILSLNILGLFTCFSERWTTYYYKALGVICKIYYPILIVVFVIISVVDLYFYNFFMSHISVIIFGLVDDDTAAVMKSIWTDYPIVWAILGFVAVILVISLLARKLVNKVFISKPCNLLISFISLAILIFVFMFGIRGTFAFYTLKITDSVISQHVFINTLVPNGLFSFKNAFKDKKSQNIDTDISKTMKQWGFSSPSEAVSIYTKRNVVNDTDSLMNALYTTTPYDSFLEQNPPNVVFLQMESMSEHFIDLHNKESFDLLGALDEELKHCIHFSNFLSSTGATINSLEALAINSPITPVAQSIYLNDTLETASAKPFKEKGYKTHFITGSKLGWRNIGTFLPNQYFDNVEGNVGIKEHIPNSTENEWGVFDEFMFDRIFELLQEGNTPQYFYGMTITNHTPYSLPKNYEAYPIAIPEKIKSALSSDMEHVKVHFKTYQYANDCLGQFIKKVRESSLGKNTIIVATGDHSARRVFDYSDADMLQQYAVPLIMYIPEQYKAQIKDLDTKAWGAHKDIFPTIYNVALSDAKYVKSGINMLDNTESSDNFAITGYNVVMNKNGCIHFGLKPVFYSWKDETMKTLLPANSKQQKILEQDLIYGKSYTASLTYLIQKTLETNHK